MPNRSQNIWSTSPSPVNKIFNGHAWSPLQVHRSYHTEPFLLCNTPSWHVSKSGVNTPLLQIAISSWEKHEWVPHLPLQMGYYLSLNTLFVVVKGMHNFWGQQIWAFFTILAIQISSILFCHQFINTLFFHLIIGWLITMLNWCWIWLVYFLYYIGKWWITQLMMSLAVANDWETHPCILVLLKVCHFNLWTCIRAGTIRVY